MRDFRLDPQTRTRLRQFGRRRRRLILLRGLCAVIVSLTLAMLAVVGLDWWTSMSDALRLWLSIGAYAIAAAVGWGTCGRMMLHIPSERQLASLMESGEPSLREELLAAVELGDSSADAKYDSPLFRSLVQQRVADRLRQVRVGRILPWRLVRGWTLAALAMITLSAVMLSIPQIQFRHRITRALLPTANLARLSRVQVTVLAPTPPDLTVPHGEPVAVEVQLAGPKVSAVTIETVSSKDVRQRIEMRYEEGRRYSAVLQPGRESLEWRVKAGDAVTRYYHLTSRARPYAKLFEKTYRYPAYTALPPNTVKEPAGDLRALEETVADIVIRPDQPVATAHLKIDWDGKQEEIGLNVATDGGLTATLPIRCSGTYQVQMIAAETGFDSRFAPRYQITAEPDQAPNVRMEQPQGNVLAASDEILQIEGEADDDLPLASLQQWVQVNDREWLRADLPNSPERKVRIRQFWDLDPLHLGAGDRVTTKIVAIDRKGQVSESAPVQVTVNATGLHLDRHAALAAKQSAAGAIQQLSVAAVARIQQVRETMKVLLDENTSDTQRALQAAGVLESAERLSRDAGLARRVLVDAQRKMPAGSDASDILATTASLLALQHRSPREITSLLREAAEATDKKVRQRQFEIARDSFERTVSFAQQADWWITTLLNADSSGTAIEDLQDVIALQRRSIPTVDLSSPDAVLARRMFARRETAIDQYLEAMNTGIKPSAQRSDNYALMEALSGIANVRKTLAPAADRERPRAKLLEFAQQLMQTLVRFHASLKSNYAESSDRLGKSRPQFQNGTFATVARQLAPVVDVMQQVGLPPDAKPSPESQMAFRRLASVEWPAVIETLRDRASLEELSAEADRQFVYDLDMIVSASDTAVARVMGQLSQDVPDSIMITEGRLTLIEIMQSAATLETAHHVADLVTNVQRMQQRERSSSSATLFTQQGRDWDFLADRLDPLADNLAGQSGNHPVKQIVERLHALARASHTIAVNAEIDRRRQHVTQANPIQEALLSVLRDLRDIERLLRPEADAARAWLQSESKSASERMREIATRTRQEEQQSRDIAEQAEKSDAATTQPAARRQRDEQRQLTEETQHILDSLRRQASLENPLDSQRRELARDVDDATAMLRPPTQAAAQSLQKASDAAQSQDQSQNLAQAADHQQRLADLLKQLADHFEKAFAGDEVADSREALRQAEQQLAMPDQFREMQERLDKLAQLAEKTPQELLAELERELKRNRPMQRELDEVTRDILESARSDLSADAQKQRDLADRIEMSDAKMANASDPMLKQLQEIAQQARELAEKQIPAIAKDGRAATSSRMDEPLNQAAGALRNSAKQAEQAAKPEVSATARSRSTPALVASLEQSAANLDQAAERAGEPNKRVAAKRESRAKAIEDAAALQQRAEQASQKADVAEQQLKQATEQRRKAREDAETAMRQSREATRSSGKNPQDQQLAEAARKAREAAEQAQQESQKADREMQTAQNTSQQTRQEARNLKQQAEAAKGRAKNTPDPNAQEIQQAAEAESSQDRVRETAAQARQLAERARQLGERASELANSAVPTAEALTQAVAEEHPTAQNVAENSRELSRAARHEQRLENQPASEAIQQAAGETSTTAKNRIPETAKQVGVATTANAARKPLEESAERLDQHSQQIDQLLGNQAISRNPADATASATPPIGTDASQQEDAAANTNEAGQTPGGSESSPFSQPQTARWLARTLDALDRSMHQSQPGANDQNANSADQSSQADAADAMAAALQAQANAMQNARAQQAALSALMNDTPGAPESEGLAESKDGAAIDGGQLAKGQLPELGPADNEEWGRLPPSQMRDLMEGQREVVSEEYRRMVEAYFRAVAERAKGERKP